MDVSSPARRRGGGARGDRSESVYPHGRDPRPGGYDHEAADRVVPAEVGLSPKAYARIRRLKAAQDARDKAEAKARERGDDGDTATGKGATAAAAATPTPKAQRNFTDPDSKIMITSDGAFHQCYNASSRR